jgi:putative transposase
MTALALLTPVDMPAYPRHLPHFHYRGAQRYFLTFCCADRQARFSDEAPVTLVLEQFLRAGTAAGCAISAYVFMPDHAHLLIEGACADADGRQFFRLAKQLSGYRYQRAFGRRLWQRYAYEHLIRNDFATLSVMRYIVENPVRAGLVAQVDDYPFIGTGRYALADVLEAVAIRRNWAG